MADLLAIKTEDIGDDSSYESLGADSLDTVEIIMGIEDEFGIAIDDSEVEQLKTFAEVVAVVTKKIQAKE